MKTVARWRAALWRIPILLGVLTVVGLVSALLGDGAWDAVSWVALGCPVAVGAWYATRPRFAVRITTGSGRGASNSAP